MPCPCFLPEAPMPRDAGPRPARAPLADVHTGTCSVGGDVDLSTMIEACNFGYARGRCTSFPSGLPCDAYRFSAPRDSFADIVEIVWIAEKDYSPVSHGRARYSRELHGFLDSVEDPVLRQQALAFATAFVHA
jgi:hypothetical protein